MATHDSPPPARRLLPQEIADVLNFAIPAHLATLDSAGFPRIVPLWFLWKTEAFIYPVACRVVMCRTWLVIHVWVSVLR